MKKAKKNILLYIGIFIITFIYSFFISNVYNDEIWNYGVAYNISNGMIPYRDFNLITTPLYPFLAVPFIKIIGNYLYSFHIFNSFIVSFIIFIIIKKLGPKGSILIPFILLNIYPNYNILSILLLLILLEEIDKDSKRKDQIISLLVSLLFLTKQTIGITLILPMLLYSKNKMKSIINFSIPIFIFLIYLLWNNALYNFIDYCFLGLFDFGTNNKILFFLPIELIICFILVYLLIKSNFKNKKIFYILMYQIVTVPIFDDYHFMIALIPVLYYFLSNLKIKNYKIKYYFLIMLFLCISWNFYLHNGTFGYLYSDKNSYLYKRNFDQNVEDTIKNISKYILTQKKDYDQIFIFSATTYYIKLNINEPLTKYDMICNGNMGYKGDKKYINEIKEYCKNNKCMFILYKYEYSSLSQTNKNIINYVKENYEIKEQYNVFNIYTN